MEYKLQEKEGPISKEDQIKYEEEQLNKEEKIKYQEEEEINKKNQINKENQIIQEKQINQINQINQQNQIRIQEKQEGMWLGLLIGDALGAVLEFKRGISQKEVDWAMKMPGGGAHRVAPGQVTDDGELSLCLAHGLSAGRGKLDLNLIASFFGEWFKSKPFDCGNTVRRAVPKAVNMKVHQAEMVRRGANNKDSLSSQSNGSLMLLAPYCVWAHKLSEDEIATGAKQITILTHPNYFCQLSNIFYSILAKYILQEIQGLKAVEMTLDYFKQNYNKSEQEKIFIGWIQKVIEGQLPSTQKIGSGNVQVALSYAVYYVIKEDISFEDSMKQLLILGGDTDTNAAIMGALKGGQIGRSNLPLNLQEKVLQKDNKRNNRDAFLKPSKHFQSLVENLIKIAPTKLEMVGDSESYVKKK